MQFNRQCDNINEWIEDIENQLSSSDHGKDVTSANSLLKKHKVKHIYTSEYTLLCNILYLIIVSYHCFIFVTLIKIVTFRTNCIFYFHHYEY